MTTGIYCLVFGKDKVYIGQAVDIKIRYGKHLNRLSKETNISCRNIKLFNAYTNLGPPELFILEVCSIESLDDLERYWIDEFDAINNGLNICSGGKSGRGVHNGSSVYCEKDILDVFNLLCSEECFTYTHIEKATNVPIHIVSGIACGSIHRWLEEKYPEEYCQLELLREDRLKKTNTLGHRKIYAANSGIIYPIIIDIHGIEYTVKSARVFAKEHLVDAGNLIKMMDGTYEKCGVFKLKNLGDNVKRVSIVYGSIRAPDGAIYDNITNIKQFAESHNLDPSSIGKVLRKAKKSYKGWTLA